jgi:hypothetical protein
LPFTLDETLLRLLSTCAEIETSIKNRNAGLQRH